MKRALSTLELKKIAIIALSAIIAIFFFIRNLFSFFSVLSLGRFLRSSTITAWWEYHYHASVTPLPHSGNIITKLW